MPPIIRIGTHIQINQLPTMQSTSNLMQVALQTVCLRPFYRAAVYCAGTRTRHASISQLFNRPTANGAAAARATGRILTDT